MDIAQVSVNKVCCGIINNLLLSLNCLSSPISDLSELRDGSALVEIIENFECAYGLCQRRDGNYVFIKNWLSKQGVFLGQGRSVDEILTSGQLSHLAMLCYAIATVFLNNDDFLRRRLKNYNFYVEDSDMIEVILFTKWKLCEEELELKNDRIHHLEQQLISFNNDNTTLRNDLVEAKNKNSELHSEMKKKDEEHKVLVSRLIAELSHLKFKLKETQIELDL